MAVTYVAGHTNGIYRCIPMTTVVMQIHSLCYMHIACCVRSDKHLVMMSTGTHVSHHVKHLLF